MDQNKTNLIIGEEAEAAKEDAGIPDQVRGASQEGTSSTEPGASLEPQPREKKRGWLSGSKFKRLQREQAAERGETPNSRGKTAKGSTGGAEGEGTSAGTVRTPLASKGSTSRGASSGVKGKPSTDTAKATSSGKPLMVEKRKFHQRSSAETPREDLKRRKASKGESYASVASTLPRVALTCGDYLGKEMPQEVVDKLREKVVERVLKLEVGKNFIPRFKDTFPKRGMLVMVCADEQTKKWVEENVGELVIGPALIPRVIQPEDFPKFVKVGVFLPPGIKDADDLIKIIGIQNDILDTSGWVVVNKSVEGSTDYRLLSMSQASFEVLRENDFRAFAGVAEVVFKPLLRSGERSKEVTAEPAGAGDPLTE